jgi:iron complex outermembrane receptor protein
LIERVEVIRGPGSSLYGNNAVFAVINIITRSGQSYGGAEAAASYASYNTTTGRLSYGQNFKNGLRIALSGTYLHTAGDDGLYYPVYAATHRGYADQNGAARAPSAFASIGLGDLSFEAGFVDRREITPAAYTSVFNDPQGIERDQRGFAELKLEHRFASEWELTARVYYDRYRYVGFYPNPEYAYGQPLYPGPITVNSDDDDQDSVGGEVKIDRTFFERHFFTVGAEYRTDLTLDQRNFNRGGVTFLDSHATEHTAGVYLQDEYSIEPNLLLNVGARYDYFASFGDTVNPRSALVYNPTPSATIKALYGQAFRAPNAYEMYYEAPGYTATPRLKPEVIHSYELDYDQALGASLRLTSALFYYKVDDLISFGLDSKGNSTFGNIAAATSQGAEIGLDSILAAGWRARLSYTYADARDAATGMRLTDSPESVAKFSLTMPVGQRLGAATLEVRGLSSRTTVQGNTLAGYAVANLTLLSRSFAHGLQVSAGVYNLLDKPYSDPVGSDFLADSVRQHGREFRIKVTEKF